MSVGDTACYRDDAFNAVFRLMGRSREHDWVLIRLLDFHVDDSEGVDQNIVTQKGKLSDQVLAGKIKLEQLCYTKFPKRYQRLPLIFDERDQFVFGLPAVFSITKSLIDKAKNRERNFDQVAVSNMFIFGEVLGNRTPLDAKMSDTEFSEYAKTILEPYHFMFTALLKSAVAYSNKTYKLDYHPADGSAPKPLQNRETSILGFDAMYPFPGLLIIKHLGKVYFLTKDDVKRVEKIVKGIALARFYARTHSILEPQERASFVNAVDAYCDQLVVNCKKQSFDRAQLVCRAYDVIIHTYMARIASDVDNQAFVEQVSKYKREELGNVVDRDSVLGLVDGLPYREALEVLQIYKVLPAPDFDPFGAAKRQKELYKLQNRITDETFYQLILAYHKWLMIRAFHARHKFCPGYVLYPEREDLPNWMHEYPNIDPVHIPVTDVDYIDIAGSFVYNDHPVDVLDLLKDKAICPASINSVRNQADIDVMDRKEKNYLLDVINREEEVNTQNLRAELGDGQLDVRCEDKAEAKKPNGRWFMEAHSNARMVISEYEQSIADYGKGLEGFMQGKGLIEKQEMMNFVTEYFEADEEGLQLYVSFDIEKFSPRLPLRVHVDLDKQWSEAFGIKDLDNCRKILTEGKLHYVKHSVHASIQKTGNDFEGFFGRKLTFYHLAVMHAARRILGEKKIAKGKYRFAAQIDDGLMRLVVDKKMLPLLKPELEKIWLSAGMQISWDKTYISSNFAIFLNEIRWQGRAINAGMRALVKVRNHEETIVPSLPDDLNTLEATIRGAYVSGVTPKAAYYIYAYLAVDLVHKWGPKSYEFRNEHIVWYFAPRQLGGLGLANAQTLLGSLDQSQFINGLANLKVMQVRVKTLKQQVDSVLNQPMREVSERVSMSNPTSLRREANIIRDDRLKVSLRNALGKRDAFPQLDRLIDKEAQNNAESLMSHLSNEQTLPVELRELWYESSVLSAIDAFISKVMTTGTAKVLLPKRTLFRIAIANTIETRGIISKW